MCGARCLPANWSVFAVRFPALSTVYVAPSIVLPGQLVQDTLQARQIVIGVVGGHIVRASHLRAAAQRVISEAE